MVKTDEFIAARDCPKDCPFRDRIASGQTMIFCSFGLYVDLIEAGRHTRTEVLPDGTVNYHIPPNCDAYEKYKDKKKYVAQIKKYYERHQLRLHHKHFFDPELYVTGHRHSAISKHRK